MANPDNGFSIVDILDFEGHSGRATIHIDPLTPEQEEARRQKHALEIENLARATAVRDEEKYGVFLGAKPEPRGVVFEAPRQVAPSAEVHAPAPQPAA